MALPVSDFLVTDDLTILLSVIAATVFLLNNVYKPQPLIHPILLGRQSDVGRARNAGQSAVYRNYGTGSMGRFPLRPARDVHVLADFIRPDVETPRTLWSTKLTNSHLQDRAAAFGTGLLRLAYLQPQKSTVLLLLNDSLEFIIADLALASHSICSLTLSSSNLLSPVLESHTPTAILTHAFLLPQILELIYESNDRQAEHTIVVVGEPSSQAMASVASNIKVLKFADIERQGIKTEKVLSPIPKPSDVFTISFYENSAGHLQGVQLTHDNLVAGVTAIRALFPLTSTSSSLDTIVSGHSMSGGYGRAVAYTAIFDGTSFATLPTSELYHVDEKDVKEESAEVIAIKKYPTPSPTMLFIKPGHLRSLVSGIIEEAKKSWLLYPIAWRHKLAGIADGFITNQSLWDRLVFDRARSTVLGECASTLRVVVVSGGHIEADLLTPARVALSVPLVNALTHPLVPAPILASNPLDLQDFPLTTKSGLRWFAHTGPPVVNVEVRLSGVNDEIVENGGDPMGKLAVRGPPVGKLVQLDDYVDVPLGSEGEAEGNGWTSLDVKFRAQANGTFQAVNN